MSTITDAQPAWFQDLVRELGPVLIGHLVKAGADAVTMGKMPSLDAFAIEGARKVRDILPDPLPNVAVIDRARAEIARREATMRAEADVVATYVAENPSPLSGDAFVGILANTPTGADEPE